MPGQLGVTTFSARVGGAACQCLGVAASTGLLSLLRSTLRNGGCEVGAAGWDVCVCRGWGWWQRGWWEGEKGGSGIL